MISLSLAIFNILPIPALDGGRLLGIIIQKVFGLKGDRYFAIENYINIIFFVLMMGAGILMLFKDLSKIRGLF
jgi:regulator of sigma E protease